MGLCTCRTRRSRGNSGCPQSFLAIHRMRRVLHIATHTSTHRRPVAPSNTCSYDDPRWASTTRRCRGRSCTGGSTAGRPSNVPEHANGGDSPAWSRKRQPFERQPSGGSPGAGRPTPSCTATRTSASSTAPATPRSWPRRPPASASRPSPSPTTTASTASSASPRRPGPWRCRTVFGAELTLGLTGPQNGDADPEGHHLLVLARDPDGYARLARAISRAPSSRGPREGQAGLRPRRARRPPTAATGSCSPAAARARCRPPSSPTGPAAAAPRPGRPRRPVRARQRRRRAVGPRRAARLGPQRRPGRAGRPPPGSPSSPPTTSTTPRRPGARWPPPWPRCGPAAASTRSTAGCRPASARPPAVGRRAGAPLPPLPGRRRAGRRARAWPAPSTCSLVAPELPPFPCPDGLDEMQFLRRLVDGGGHAPLRAPRPRTGRRPGASSTTSSPSSRSSASPATSSSCGTSSASAGTPTSTARAGAAPPTGGLLRPRHHQRRRRRGSACCSSASCRPSATARPTSTSTSSRTGGRRPSSTSTPSTGASTPPRSPTSSPTGPSRRSATWPRPSASPPASRTRGASRPTPWGSVRSTVALPDHDIPAAVLALPSEVEHFPRHLGIHSGGMVICDRPVIEVCPVEWARFTGRTAPARADPHGAAVGQGRLRRRRAW